MAVTAEVEQGRLAPLQWAGPPLTVVTSLVWHKDKWLSPALRAFMETTRATLRA
jgi:DNA-binding transcriptional LysR family regulator